MLLLKKKLFFIFNPFAGKGGIKNHLLGMIDTKTEKKKE